MPGHTRQQVSATGLCDLSPSVHCIGDNVNLCHFVAATWCTNSNQFEFVRKIMSQRQGFFIKMGMLHKGNCRCDLSLRHVAATCHLVCPSLYDWNRLDQFVYMIFRAARESWKHCSRTSCTMLVPLLSLLLLSRLDEMMFSPYKTNTLPSRHARRVTKIISLGELKWIIELKYSMAII